MLLKLCQIADSARELRKQKPTIANDLGDDGKTWENAKPSKIIGTKQ